MDRKRRLMENNNGWPLRSQLFDGAPFRLPLLSTAVPASAATGTTATFTRATAKTWPNNDGYLVTGVAGEIGFVGARRVRNLLTFTEDLTNAVNQVARLTKTNATTLTETAVLGTHVVFQYSAESYVSGNKYVLSCRIKFTQRSGWVIFGATNSASSMACVRAFNPSLGTFGSYVGDVGATFIGYDISDVDSEGFSRISIVFTPTSTTVGGGFQLYIDPSSNGSGTVSYTGDTGVSIQATDFQLEDITGRTDQTTPSEYVSVGVASAPYYHGSAADGVRAYPYDLSGNPIPSTTLLGYSAEGARTNLCLQSNAFTTTWVAAGGTPTATQNVVGPDGATSAWTVTDNDPANNEAFSTPSILLTAAAYTFSMFVKKTTGVQTSYPCLWFLDAAITTILPCTIDTTNGTATVWTAYTGLAIMAGGSARCTSYNADYWRVELTGTGTAANWTVRFGPALTTNPTQSSGIFDVTAQGSAVFYGAQVELGSFASSYIATTTIAVTRNSDIDSVSTSGNITAAAGSVYLEFTPTHSPSGTIAFWGTYVDASNYTAILHDATNLIFRKRIAGVNYDATIANAFVSGTTYKVCGTWGAAGVTITLNGTDGTPSADTTAAQIAATMQWGADGNSLQQPFASVRNCRDWLRQLSSSERRAITA